MDSNVILDIILIVLAILNMITGNISAFWFICLMVVIVAAGYDLIKTLRKKKL